MCEGPGGRYSSAALTGRPVKTFAFWRGADGVIEGEGVSCCLHVLSVQLALCLPPLGLPSSLSVPFCFFPSMPCSRQLLGAGRLSALQETPPPPPGLAREGGGGRRGAVRLSESRTLNYSEESGSW